MIFKSFSIRGKYLTGFAKGSTQKTYVINFDIEFFKKYWEKEKIKLEDFLNKRAYVIANVRNTYASKGTRFIKINKENK